VSASIVSIAARLPRLSAALAERLEADRWRGPLLLGNVVAAVVAFAVMRYGSNGFGWDAQGMWQIDVQHPYWAFDYGTSGGYFYSPAFAQFLAPFGLLPWIAFVGLLLGAEITALGWLVGWRWIGYALLLPPVMDELKGPNIGLLLAAGIVLSFERPALWAFVLLTKVTPGVGVLWFAIRREWRNLAVALGVTAVIAAVSFAVASGAWADWIALLRDNAARPTDQVPLLIRLPIAAVLTVYAARTNKPWLVPVAALLGVAVIWRPHFVLLLGSVAAWRLRDRLAVTRTPPGPSIGPSRLRI
jgi:hypothetical protein